MQVPPEVEQDADVELDLGRVTSESQMAGLWLLFAVGVCHVIWTVSWIQTGQRTLASMIFPAMVLGVWLGAGNERWWVRWGLFAFASPMIQFALEPNPPMSLWRASSLHHTRLMVGLLILSIAAFSYAGPRLIAGRFTPGRVRKFSLGDLFMAVTVGSMVVLLWQYAFYEFHWNADLAWRYVREASFIVPLGAVIAAVAWPLQFSGQDAETQALRRRATRLAVVTYVAAPGACIALALLIYGVPNWDEAAGALMAWPGTVLAIYPIQFCCYLRGIEWLRPVERSAGEPVVEAGEL